MANDFFRFKQFTVQQSRCAMKVSTDACLLGAWMSFGESVEKLLDIGAGTGLLSLMAAQRFPQAKITALEIDPEAAAQAAENGADSPFRERVEVVCADVRKFQSPELFDGIFCNPPFFQNSLQGPQAARNRARHGDADSLSLEDLCAAVARLLKPSGSLMLLLPFTAAESWEKTAFSGGLQLVEKVLVQPLPHKAPNRVLYHWKKEESGSEVPQISELVLYESYGKYTEESAALLRPFYQNL